MPKALTILLAAVFAIGAGHAVYADHDMGQPGLLSVTFIDLETTGDSTLIVMPNESTVLIDGGMPAAYPNIRDTLDDFGISHIDVIIVTHPDQDHVAGFNNLLADDQYTVGQVLINPTPKDTQTYQRFLSQIEYQGIELINAHAGHKISLDDSVSMEIIGPADELIPKGTNASSSNTNSLITLLEFGDFEFLFTGDATYKTEEWLIDNVAPDKLDVDIMNAPHHGSKHASTQEFIDATSPELVVFSSDVDNRYGHPHQEAIMRYQSSGIGVLLHTGTEGDILIQTDGERCSLITRDMGEVPCFVGVQEVSGDSGLVSPMSKTLEVYAYGDNNADGIKAVGESALIDVTIYVYEYDTGKLSTLKTGRDGMAKSDITSETWVALAVPSAPAYITEPVMFTVGGIQVDYPGVLYVDGSSEDTYYMQVGIAPGP